MLRMLLEDLLARLEAFLVLSVLVELEDALERRRFFGWQFPVLAHLSRR